MRPDFSDARILVIGDVFLDEYIYGEVDRLSPEAPVPVLRKTGFLTRMGGAGNVAQNIVSVGGKVRLVGAVGKDSAGQRLMFQSAADLCSDFLIEVEGYATGVKTRYIAGHQQVLRVDEEQKCTVPENMLESAALKALDGCHVVVLSDYGKGVLTDRTAQAVINRARAVDIPVIADPSARNWSRYRWSDYVTPNRAELDDAAGFPVPPGEVVAECRKMIGRFGLKGVIATRSEDGLMLVSEHTEEHIGTEAREVFDVSGAGDTLVAVLACGLAARLNISEAAHLANRAAGIVVGKVGTAVAAPEELWPEAKAIETGDVLEEAARWREQGLRIGFTNGCFDGIHPGHVATLEYAKQHCDRLIVGLNGDLSVFRLKGEGRPVRYAVERAAVLRALKYVDEVVVFHEDTPADLVAALKPDVMVKGGDYDAEDVVGAEHAGEVVIAPYLDGHSSTEILNRCSAPT